MLLNGTLDQITVTGNVGAGTAPGVNSGLAVSALGLGDAFARANWAGLPPNDVFPKAEGALIGTGDRAHVASDDFNGTARNGRTDVGAYVFDARGNPGWTLADDFKSETSAPPGGSAGSAGSAGSGGSTGGGSSAGRAGGAGSGSGGRAGAGRGAAGTGATRDAGTDSGVVDGSTVPAPDGGSGCGCRTSAPRTANLAEACLGLAFVALTARRLRRRPRG